MTDKKQLYSDLYQQGEEVLRRHNPCKVTNGRCLSGNFCCQGCKHLGLTGCKVESLMCKLWLCNAAQCTPDGRVAIQELRALNKIAYEERIPMVFRGSKAESFASSSKEERSE
jgi:hypothetical protein